MITLYLRGRVRPGAQRDLERFLAEARAFYESPGGICVRLQWDLADPCAFVEIMEYSDRAAYDADQRRVEEDPLMGAWLTRWHELLDGPVDVTAVEEHALPVSGCPKPGGGGRDCAQTRVVVPGSGVAL